MKQLLQQYAAYNIWANKIITERIAQLPEDIIYKETASSFSSIYATVVHLMDVEGLWWQRLKLVEHPTWPGKTFDGNFEKLAGELLFLSKQWYEWISSANEINFTHVFAYYNSKKEYFKQPVYEMLLHLYNNKIYQRRQLVTMMSQNELEKITTTDFIVLSRKKKNN